MTIAEHMRFHRFTEPRLVDEWDLDDFDPWRLSDADAPATALAPLRGQAPLRGLGQSRSSHGAGRR